MDHTIWWSLTGPGQESTWTIILVEQFHLDKKSLLQNLSPEEEFEEPPLYNTLKNNLRKLLCKEIWNFYIFIQKICGTCIIIPIYTTTVWTVGIINLLHSYIAFEICMNRSCREQKCEVSITSVLDKQTMLTLESLCNCKMFLQVEV